MEIALLGLTALFLVLLVPLFFISCRQFFAFTIPARAFANLTVAMPVVSLGALSLSFADLLAMMTIFFAVLHLAGNFRQVMVNQWVRLAMVFLLVFVFLVILAAVSGHVGSGRIVEAAKVISWLIYLPVGLSLFADGAAVALLKRSGVLAAAITVFGLILGQVLGVGETAYDLGLMHLGFFSSEAALASSLVGCLLFFFLPDNPLRRQSAIRQWVKRAGVMTLLVLVALVMVRSVVIGVFLYLVLFVMTKRTAGLFKTMTLMAGTVIIFSGIVGGVLYFNQQYVEVRFKDVQKYLDSGDLTTLGSGRLSLTRKYMEKFNSLSLPAQLFGTDFYANSGQGQSRTYRSVQFGTHNDALQILFMVGIVGLLCYALMWVFLAGALWISLKRLSDPYYRQLAAVGVGAGGMYAVLVFHGAIFHVFLMQSMCIILGAVLGSIFAETHWTQREVMV